ncbi:MAG: hypothetical protein JRN13_05925 [Nitrososphaerota archaeon]|jgi:ribosomal protein L12E/L44/L45/RPP1/RPP2|nr:hypothetical protein [Nitrososphaerota archaeon]MDG6972852.1 hypothetical protein [Nitrososphaerota archaeon]MDG6977452.1 hypothetical protein [Nitrososphaerota archaeon]MDG7018170.1 hypothetical protein [Nitrososphaerota archaeon]MDG7019637.1 hypothetical protein [Nitrososphaerota archaeon]
MKKTILVRGVEVEAYRRAKAAAALKGVSIGTAVSQALREWAGAPDAAPTDAEVRADRDFVKRNWAKLEPHKGRTVVVQGGKLRGVFDDLDAATEFSSRFEVALVFTVKGPPVERELEIGAEMAV